MTPKVKPRQPSKATPKAKAKPAAARPEPEERPPVPPRTLRQQVWDTPRVLLSQICEVCDRVKGCRCTTCLSSYVPSVQARLARSCDADWNDRAETRLGDALHHVARRLGRHPGAIRERQAAVFSTFHQLVTGEATARDWAGQLPPDPPQPQTLTAESKRKTSCIPGRYPDVNHGSSHEERCLRFDMAAAARTAAKAAQDAATAARAAEARKLAAAEAGTAEAVEAKPKAATTDKAAKKAKAKAKARAAAAAKAEALAAKKAERRQRREQRRAAKAKEE
ncbi:unnamed protein product, partial [Symbiodinium sp. CCMP2592]